MPLTVLNTCVLPLLPLLPIAVIWAWSRSLPRDVTIPRLWIVLGLGALFVVALLRASRGAFSPASGEIGVLQALWVVVTHPVWFLLGLLGFVHLMIFPIVDEERRRASRILSGAAFVAFCLAMFWFVLADPNTAVGSFAGFVRFTPINLSIGAALAFATKFLRDEKLKDRQIGIVTLLMIALFVGGVGALIFADL
jgi:hypothetical protein